MGQTRLTFLATLRAGLRGADPVAMDDAIADYASHFDVGISQGRDEDEIGAALGDPLVLADALRLEMRMERFSASPSPASAARLIGAAIGVGALNAGLLFVGLPLLCLLLFMGAIALATVFAAGVWFLFAGAGTGFGVFVNALAGAGLILAAIAIGAGLALIAIVFVRGVGRHARAQHKGLRGFNPIQESAP